MSKLNFESKSKFLKSLNIILFIAKIDRFNQAKKNQTIKTSIKLTTNNAHQLFIETNDIRYIKRTYLIVWITKMLWIKKFEKKPNKFF